MAFSIMAICQTDQKGCPYADPYPGEGGFGDLKIRDFLENGFFNIYFYMNKCFRG